MTNLKPLSHLSGQTASQKPGQTPTPLTNSPNTHPVQLLNPGQLFQSVFQPQDKHMAPTGTKGTALPMMNLTQNTLESKMQKALSVAQSEWDKGVKETKGKPNRGKEVDKYAAAVGGIIGETWCGYFLGYAYKEAGMKEPIHLASTLRVQNFCKAPNSGRQFIDVRDISNPAKNAYNYNALPIIPGDIVVFNEGDDSHLGMVESYEQTTGKLTTLEGNSGGGTAKLNDGSDTQVVRDGNAVVRKVYDLSRKYIRDKITGFGRLALGDFK